MATGIAVTIDGKRYELWLGQITPSLARECRQATGLPPSAFLASPDIDSAAVIAWLSQRVDGGKKTLAQMEKGITYEHQPDVEGLDDTPDSALETQAAAEISADPEAPGDAS